MTDSLAWHGTRGDSTWAPPKCVVSSDIKARPHYTDIDASEYRDTDEVLDAKVKLLLTMMRDSSNFVVYSGAGLSTASGIGDYASRAAGSVVRVAEKSGSRLDLEPTYSHRVLAALEKIDVLKHWIQQNHDGLAQKAGYPFLKLNEIHGGWFDRTNPVVQMDGVDRADLWAWLQEWAELADMVLVLGTSLSGMEADHVASRAAEKFGQGTSQGMVIVNMQRTPMDARSQLRIFAPIDVVMKKIASKYRLKLDTKIHRPYPTPDEMKEVRRRAKRLGVKVAI